MTLARAAAFGAVALLALPLRIVAVWSPTPEASQRCWSMGSQAS
jgi:hypothetical protein